MTITKASPEQQIDLAIKLAGKLTPEEVMSYLKQHHYKLNNIEYNATRVATAVGMFDRLYKGAKAGHVVANKSKGLYIK